MRRVHPKLVFAVTALFVLSLVGSAAAQARQRPPGSGSGAKAVPRGGGSGGGSTMGHPGSGGGRQGSGGSQSSPRTGSRPGTPAEPGHAVPRPPGSYGRPGPGYGHGGGYGHYPGYGYGGSWGWSAGFYWGYPGYYPWFWGGWGWGFSPYYWGPYGYPYYAPYSYYGSSATTLRVIATPKDAEVFVDGYFAGIVDDLDGFFQGIAVEPGGREVTLYKEGFRTHTERLYITPYQSYKLRHTMQPLAPGEPNPSRPVPLDQGAQPGYPGNPAWPPPPSQPPPPPAPTTVSVEPPADVPSNFGQLAIRVQPFGAQVLIDDEPWQTPVDSDRLVVFLKPGTHRVEVRKDGFDPFVTSVEVKKGETAILNVSLGRVSGV